MTPTGELCQAIALALPNVVDVRARANGLGLCIHGARIVIETLRRYRVDCYALACEVVIRNPVEAAALEELNRELGGALTQAAIDAALVAARPRGGYGILVGSGQDMRPGGWPGHLVVVAERRWQIDPTLGQAARPAYGIDLGPVCMPVTEPYLRGRERLPGYVRGSMVIYTARPGDKSYQAGRAWREPELDAVDALVAEIEGR